MSNSVRVESLQWWRELEGQDRFDIVNLWKKMTDDFRKEWAYWMIENSDSAIERIYREFIQEENFS